MKEKQKNIILLALLLEYFNKEYSMKPDDVIENYNKDKTINTLDNLFVKDGLTKDELIKLSNSLYTKLKLNK